MRGHCQISNCYGVFRSRPDIYLLSTINIIGIDPAARMIILMLDGPKTRTLDSRAASRLSGHHDAAAATWSIALVCSLRAWAVPNQVQTSQPRKPQVLLTATRRWKAVWLIDIDINVIYMYMAHGYAGLETVDASALYVPSRYGINIGHNLDPNTFHPNVDADQVSNAAVVPEAPKELPRSKNREVARRLVDFVGRIVG